MDKKKDLYDIRSFEAEEINEINTYVTTQIPQSELPKLFILTEEPIKKIKTFIMVYRIVLACRDYVGEQETKEKLNNFLVTGKEAYEEIYPVFIKYDGAKINYGSDDLEEDLFNLVIKYNNQINDFSNKFIVFAEKLELIPTDSVGGVKMEKEEGEEFYKSASKLVDN